MPSAVLAATLTCIPMMPVLTQFNPLSAAPKPLQLHLTDHQKVLLTEIQDEFHAKMEKVLDDKQFKALRHATHSEHKSFILVLDDLKLTAEQNKKVSELKKQETATENAVLTPEQRKLIQEFKDSHKKSSK